MENKRIETYGDFTQFVEILLRMTKGKKIGGLVADDSYNGNPRSDLVEMSRAEEYEEKAGQSAGQDVEAVEEEVAEVEEEVEEAPKAAKKVAVAAAPKATKKAAVDDLISDFFK